jgi:hypothetical protein
MTVFVFELIRTFGCKIKGIKFSALASKGLFLSFPRKRGRQNFSYSPKAGVFGK